VSWGYPQGKILFRPEFKKIYNITFTPPHWRTILCLVFAVFCPNSNRGGSPAFDFKIKNNPKHPSTLKKKFPIYKNTKFTIWKNMALQDRIPGYSFYSGLTPPHLDTLLTVVLCQTFPFPLPLLPPPPSSSLLSPPLFFHISTLTLFYFFFLFDYSVFVFHISFYFGFVVFFFFLFLCFGVLPPPTHGRLAPFSLLF